MNPLKKYLENRFLTQVLTQALILAMNDLSLCIKELSAQLSAIAEKKPIDPSAEQEIMKEGEVN